MKTWICTTLVNFMGPVQGAARLYAYLKNKGHNVELKDLNQDIYFTLLSKNYLNDVFEKLKAMLFPIMADKFYRKDIGSILLNSSSDGLRALAAKGFLSRMSKAKALTTIPVI